MFTSVFVQLSLQVHRSRSPHEWLQWPAEEEDAVGEAARLLQPAGCQQHQAHTDGLDAGLPPLQGQRRHGQRRLLQGKKKFMQLNLLETAKKLWNVLCIFFCSVLSLLNFLNYLLILYRFGPSSMS